MKKCFLFLLTVFAVLACDEKKEEEQVLLSESNGKINNISVIIDDNLWNSNLGDSLRVKFAASVDGLSSEEPIFTINQYPTKIFKGFVQKSRNIIIVEKKEKASFATQKNAFAKPQNVFYISGNTEDEILQVLNQKSDQIINDIKNAEIVERQRTIRKKLISDDKVTARFGIKLDIGAGYKYDMVKDKFLWIRKEFSTGYNSILIYEVPIKSIDNDSVAIQNIVKMRDSIGKANIHGTLDNTWMVTEAAFTPFLNEVKLTGKKTYETKGTWELKNDYMAGPFINYAIKDEKNNRYLILEGFTFNPAQSKRDLMFELEAMIKSVRFVE